MTTIAGTVRVTLGADLVTIRELVDHLEVLDDHLHQLAHGMDLDTDEGATVGHVATRALRAWAEMRHAQTILAELLIDGRPTPDPLATALPASTDRA